MKRQAGTSTAKVGDLSLWELGFEDLTARCVAGACLYIGGVMQELHKPTVAEFPWDLVAHNAAEAQCSWAEALQRLARSEIVPEFRSVR